MAGSAVELAVASFLFLFLELLILRWIPSYVRIIAYFSNVILISCFAGFGLGCVRKDKGLFAFFPYLLLAELLATHYLAGAGVGNPFGAEESFFTVSAGLNWYLVIPSIFALNSLLFATVGQRVARELDRLPPLKGYAVNILGSLLGVGAFAGMSFLQVRPTWHFAGCCACGLWLLRSSSKSALGLASAALLSAGLLVHQREVRSLWSPYNKINVMPFHTAPESGSFLLAANNDVHQVALNLSDSMASRSEQLRQWQDVYNLPYRLLGRSPDRVLVLGAGTGNDVAAALRNGSAHVDAVELDPVIASLGSRWHPERPFSDLRVSLSVTDARSYLRQGHGLYDEIVMGWLDSHRIFSSLSNVRQDNFVYTAESLGEIRSLLKPNGMLCLSFFVGKTWIRDKIARMIRAAFGHDARIYAYPGGAYGMAGMSFAVRAGPEGRPTPPPRGFVELPEAAPEASPAAMPLDDWPFLYYRDRVISPEYLWTLGLLLGVTVLSVLAAVPWRELRKGSDLTFFFLGAGFMLLEARNVTALALLYGSTWIVASAVISSVLVMSLIANALVRSSFLGDEKLSWMLLLAALLTTIYVHSPRLGAFRLAATAAQTLHVCATFLFAGMIFSRIFAVTPSPSLALGWNVLGAVLGGLCEYLSLIVGLRALLWLACAFYAAAWIARRRQVRALRIR